MDKRQTELAVSVPTLPRPVRTLPQALAAAHKMSFDLGPERKPPWHVPADTARHHVPVTVYGRPGCWRLWYLPAPPAHVIEQTAAIVRAVL